MTTKALARRLQSIRVNAPVGCPACRVPMPIVILQDDEPEPSNHCAACGRVYEGLRVIRIVSVDRGPL
jgi:hypothetical protein